MVTLFLILFACIIAIFSSALYVPIFVKKAQAKKGIVDDAKPERLYALLSKISCWMAVVLIFAVFSMPFFQYRSLCQDATTVSSFEDTVLYHDDNSNTYFTVRQNFWNPFGLFDKHYLDKDEAEIIRSKMQQYQELQKELNTI